MKYKKGDTLIEVTLAVGIFSMIAIAITAVMSGGTSGAQTALETTLAREEIDTQAEALRFIHDSSIADKDSDNKKYTNLWQKITDNANELTGTSADNEILQFTPTDCAELYNGTLYNQKAFVINPRMLGHFTDAGKSIDDVFISARNDLNKDKFQPATVYPHLIYGINGDSDQELASSDFSDSLYRAEGIYVVAVRDQKTTQIATDTIKREAAFYDFYIRTCWYGSNANEPSTISTVIRLYDPGVVKTDTKSE